MGRGKKNPAGHGGGDVHDRQTARGSDDRQWEKNPEDDPLRDLRPHDEEFVDPAITDPAADEYVWPELNDENEEDD
jgi:hypothetical protein